jgi:hypothetical protein
VQPRLDQAPAEIRIWRVSGIVHANIPRTVVHSPSVIEHRRETLQRPPGPRERHDLALNVLNLFMPPQTGVTGDLAPVKCFRGHCSAFAARHHRDFAAEFLGEFPAEGVQVLAASAIGAWIVQRLATADIDYEDVDEYLDLLSA